MAECADAIDKKNHIVIFSRSSFTDLPQAIEIELTQDVMKLKAEGCQLFGLSHNPETLADMFRKMDLTEYVLQTWVFLHVQNTYCCQICLFPLGISLFPSVQF